MKAFYCDHFVLPLPAGHLFPMAKYARLRERVVAGGVVPSRDLVIPDPVTDRDLTRAHAADYVRRVAEGRLTAAAIRRIGFPWSPQLVERSRRSAGGTLGACRAALTDGVAVNLAGGTHHAGPAHGEGFCVFNDAAVAARALQAEGAVHRVAVLDTDVHQGNGTAAIFADDATVFTCSIHGANNYPFRKAASDLDLPLPDETGDAPYLEAITRGIGAVMAWRPDLVVYVAGADPYTNDRLGRLAVSQAALAERDRRVFAATRGGDVPVAAVMAGGYAPVVDDTVEIHVATVRAAAHAAAGWRGTPPLPAAPATG